MSGSIPLCQTYRNKASSCSGRMGMVQQRAWAVDDDQLFTEQEGDRYQVSWSRAGPTGGSMGPLWGGAHPPPFPAGLD